MRDENDYASMSREELRVHLDRVSRETSSWIYALANAKKELNRNFNEAYNESRGKSVAERRMDAELLTTQDKNDVFEYEGMVAYCTAIRDLLVTLLQTPNTAPLFMAQADV